MSRHVRGACSVVAAIIVTACGSGSPAPSQGPPTSLPVRGPAVSYMLDGLSTYISLALQENQSNLPGNQQAASFIQAKIVMLQNPELASEIRSGGRWASGQVTPPGSAAPIGCVFPLETMRADAIAAVRTIESVLTVVEDFLGIPLPPGMVRVWYGFVVGNSGGGGAIYTEDRATYEARTPSTRIPHDAILGHELVHSFITHESLTQFLEMYAYNVTRTGSNDPTQWIFTRNWTPGLASNQDAAALLDIYQVIGLDAMRRAYRAIRPLRPAPAQSLSAEVVEAFIAQVPSALQSEVAAKLARVTS